MKQFLIFIIILFTRSKIYSQWSELGGKNSCKSYRMITDFQIDSKGKVYVLGLFKDDLNDTTKKSGIRVYDGIAWKQIDSLRDTSVFNNTGTMVIDKNDNLYFLGARNNDSQYHYVGQYNGISFRELKGLKYSIEGKMWNRMYTDKFNNVYVFGSANSDTTFNIYKFNGNNWETLPNIHSQGLIRSVHSLAFDKSNTMYLCAYMNNGQHKVISYKSGVLKDIGTFNFYITSIHIDKNDSIYVGGLFTKPNGYPRYIAKYNGVTWSILGDNTWNITNYEIYALGEDKSNNIFSIVQSTSNFNEYLSKFDGKKWHYFEGNNWIGQITRRILQYDANSMIMNSMYNNDSGYYFISKFDLNYTSNIVENKNNEDIKLYPNPAKHIITIDISKLNNIHTIETIDILGRCVKKIDVKNKEKIDIAVSDLQKGTYYLKTVSKENEKHYKFMKE